MSQPNYYIDRNPTGGLDHFTHARSLLSQIYYRQNIYVMSAQHCDAADISQYLGPIILVTGIASFLAFCASSSLAAEHPEIRNQMSLASGVLGVIATTITAMRNSVKYDVKAEMFRGAAGQYRLLATRLEERIRQHRMAMMDESWKAEQVRLDEDKAFKQFFDDLYKLVLVTQAEMKYFPPLSVTRKWKLNKSLLPSADDQPEVSRANQQALLDKFS